MIVKKIAISKVRKNGAGMLCSFVRLRTGLRSERRPGKIPARSCNQEEGKRKTVEEHIEGLKRGAARWLFFGWRRARGEKDGVFR